MVPMAPCKHVANKQELLDGIVDLVSAEVTEPDATRGWKPARRERGVSLRNALVRHRWAVGLMEADGRPGAREPEAAQRPTGCLCEIGFSFRTAVHVPSLLDAYIYGFALQQKTLPSRRQRSPCKLRRPPGTGCPNVAARNPYLLEVVGELATEGYDYDVEFDTVLDVLLDGVDVLRSS